MSFSSSSGPRRRPLGPAPPPPTFETATSTPIPTTASTDTASTASVKAEAGAEKAPKPVSLVTIGFCVLLISLLSILSLVMGLLCVQYALSTSVGADANMAIRSMVSSTQCAAVPPASTVQGGVIAPGTYEFFIAGIVVAVLGLLFGGLLIWAQWADLKSQWATRVRTIATQFTLTTKARANALLSVILLTGLFLLIANCFAFVCMTRVNANLATNWAAIVAILAIIASVIQLLLAAIPLGLLNTNTKVLKGAHRWAKETLVTDPNSNIFTNPLDEQRARQLKRAQNYIDT